MNFKNNKRIRLYHIDLIRFVAALSVVFYHYAFRGFAKDNFSVLRFEALEGIAKYGYLGVELFFIISGFVILMSIKNSDLIDFMISRFTRLYPAFWFCVISSAFVIYFFGGETFNVTFNQVLFNLTMFNGFFSVEHVDGVYWTLLIELKFYILIGLILLLGLKKHIRLFGYFLLATSIMQLLIPFDSVDMPIKILYFLTFIDYNPYFVAGMFFYLMLQDQKIIKNIVPILVSYILALVYTSKSIESRNLDYNGVFDEYVPLIIVTSFFVVMILIALHKFDFLNKKIFYYFGLLTYPLYLIHQNIGYIIFNHAADKLNKWVLLFVVVFVMLIAAYLISRYIEQPVSSYLKSTLKSNIYLKKVKTRLPLFS